MRHVNFKPSMLPRGSQERTWFSNWLRRARAATKKAIEQAEKREEIKFNQKIWSELKAFLLKRDFINKCAYCESRVTTTDFGDAEHYRPKAGITDADRKAVAYGGAEHPGYYWLAYDWRNLLPACGQCNSGDGKMNQFPIAAGKSHVMSHKGGRTPAALDALEEPQLLHPYFHDPSKYLVFGDDGTVAAAPGANKEIGDASIRTYNLWRGDLETTRKEYQEMAWSEFLKAADNGTPVKNALEKYRSGIAPYSLACLHYVKLRYERAKPDF